VFLQSELQSFPAKGALRDFIDLVTVSLSKNPYLTIQQKREHIDWYKKYFKEKEVILKTKLGEEGIMKVTAASK